MVNSMNSRVEKYRYKEETESNVPSRVAKNQELYNGFEVPEFSRVKPNSNVKVIENSSNKIDINKIKRYVESNMEEIPDRKKIVVAESLNESSKPANIEKRIYDINSVLEKAKESRESYYEDEKYKKLRTTQYDILSKIQMYDTPEEAVAEEEFNTDEKTLIELINTVTSVKKNEDLLSELKGNENTVVTSPIEEESETFKPEEKPAAQEQQSPKIEKIENTAIKNLDKSFYTNSMSFSKEDFEGFEELEKTVKKNSLVVKFGIVILVLFAVASIFLVLKFVLNIF